MLNFMIDLVTANVTLDRHHLRAWSGVAVDEGVGLICIVEVSDNTGRPLARFEEFLDAAAQRTNPAWPRDDTEAARQLQEHALDRARAAIAANTLPTLNGHRVEVRSTDSPLR
jgi:hypothetical protein